MKKNIKSKILNQTKGFSILEVLVSVAIFSFIILVIASFFISISSSNYKTKANRESQENARRIMEAIVYEIREAKKVYTPTTTSSQLSLETSRHLPAGETSTFIDFFICGTNLCLKKESQNPIILNSESVEIESISFVNILTKSKQNFLSKFLESFQVSAQLPPPPTISSIQITLTVKYKNPNNDPFNASSVTLTSSVSLRNY